MKKFLIFTTLVSAAFLSQGCGKHSDTAAAPLIVPPACTTSGCYNGAISAGGQTNSAFYNQCMAKSGSGMGYSYNPLNGYCSGPIATGSWTTSDPSNMVINADTGSGGVTVPITIDSNDRLYLSAGGHYSSGSDSCGHSVTSDGSFDADVSVLGNTNSGIRMNDGKVAGLYYAFDGSSGLSSPQLIPKQMNLNSSYNSYSQVSVPAGASQIILGYNSSSVHCGQIILYYEIVRCVDQYGNAQSC
jgi:hypothetical protein